MPDSTRAPEGPNDTPAQSERAATLLERAWDLLGADPEQAIALTEDADALLASASETCPRRTRCRATLALAHSHAGDHADAEAYAREAADRLSEEANATSPVPPVGPGVRAARPRALGRGRPSRRPGPCSGRRGGTPPPAHSLGCTRSECSWTSASGTWNGPGNTASGPSWRHGAARTRRRSLTLAWPARTAWM